MNTGQAAQLNTNHYPCQWHSEMKHILPALKHIKLLEQLSRINVTAIHGEKH
jgi:hypothetical protein